MTMCHHSDSSKTMSELQEFTKKTIYTSFPGQTDFLPDYWTNTVGYIRHTMFVLKPKSSVLRTDLLRPLHKAFLSGLVLDAMSLARSTVVQLDVFFSSGPLWL